MKEIPTIKQESLWKYHSKSSWLGLAGQLYRDYDTNISIQFYIISTNKNSGTARVVSAFLIYINTASRSNSGLAATAANAEEEVQVTLFSTMERRKKDCKCCHLHSPRALRPLQISATIRPGGGLKGKGRESNTRSTGVAGSSEGIGQTSNLGVRLECRPIAECFLKKTVLSWDCHIAASCLGTRWQLVWMDCVQHVRTILAKEPSMNEDGRALSVLVLPPGDGQCPFLALSMSLSMLHKAVHALCLLWKQHVLLGSRGVKPWNGVIPYATKTCKQNRREWLRDTASSQATTTKLLGTFLVLLYSTTHHTIPSGARKLQYWMFVFLNDKCIHKYSTPQLDFMAHLVSMTKFQPIPPLKIFFGP